MSDTLHHALIEHRVGNLNEAGDVRTDNEIAGMTVLGGRFPCILVDRRHDVAEA